MRKQTMITVAVLALLGSAPALAADVDSEVEALKQELAAQRKLIEQLLAKQAEAPKSPTDTSELQQQLREREKAAIGAPVAAKPENPGTPQFKFYGIADVSVNEANSGYGTKTRIEGTGGFSNSRLGAQVTSTVGQVKVTALAEAGVQFDTGEAGNATPATGTNVTTPSSGGTLGTGSQVFSRQMWAGIDAGFGQISIGRQYAGSYFMMGAIGSAHGDGLYGNLTSLLPIVGAMPTRLNNSIAWSTPQVANLRGQFTYSTGSENNTHSNVVTGATTSNSKAGQGFDLTGVYSYASGQAAVSTWDLNNASFVTAGETAIAKKKGFQLAANYDFGAFQVFGDFIHGTISGGNYQNTTKTLSSATGYGASVLVPIGRSKISAGWTRLNDMSQQNKDATLYGVSYWYDLTSNALLYVTAGKELNNRNASYSLLDGGNLDGNVARTGFHPSGLEGGMNYHF